MDINLTLLSPQPASAIAVSYGLVHQHRESQRDHINIILSKQGYLTTFCHWRQNQDVLPGIAKGGKMVNIVEGV